MHRNTGNYKLLGRLKVVVKNGLEKVWWINGILPVIEWEPEVKSEFRSLSLSLSSPSLGHLDLASATDMNHNVASLFTSVK